MKAKLTTGVVTGVLALMVIGAVSTPNEDSSTPDYVVEDTTATTPATFTSEPTDSQISPAEEPTESLSPTTEPTSSPTEKETPKSSPTETPDQTSTPSPTTEPTNTPDIGSTEDNGNSENSGSGDESNFNKYNNTDQQNTEETWVLNTSSKKIHHPGCKSVPKIAPKNYKTSSESLDDLKAKGYTTCGNCF